MAEIIVTSTADSGAGTLRQAIADAQDGDVILFDSTVFPSGTTTAILLASNISINKEIAIDAGASESPRRVALDAQGSGRCLYLQSDAKVDVIGLELRNASQSGNGGAVYCASTLPCSFVNCVFSNNTGNTGGGLSTTVAADLLFERCEFSENSSSGNGGALYASSSASLTVSDCVFSGNTSSADVARRDVYLAGTSSATFSASTLNALFVYTTASVSFAGGVTLVHELTLQNNVIATIESGAALTITDSSSIGSATFASDGRGYLATAAGIDLSSATIGSSIIQVEYGAGLESFSAREITRTEIKLDWTQTDATIPVLGEQKIGNAWETVVESTAGTYNVTVEPATRHLFRAFDGASFHVDAAWHGIEALQLKVVGIVVKADAEDVNWQAITEVVNVDGAIRSGQSITILARVYDAYANETVLLNETGNIVSVVYTLEKRSKSLFDYTWTPVEGHNEVEVSSECVLEDLQTSDAWTVDQVGYSFVLTPDTTEHTLFAEPGVYRFKVKITLAEGNPVVFYEEITVAE